MRTARYAVGIADPVHIFLARNDVQAVDAAGFAYAGLGRDHRHVAVPEFREMLPQDGRHLIDILPQAAFRGREIAVVAGIGLRAGHIYRHHAGVQQGAEPRSSEIGDTPFFRVREQFLADGQAVTVLALFVVMHRIRDKGRFRIHPREHEIGGCGLQRFPRRQHRHPRGVRQVCIAGGIDKYLCSKRFRAVFAFDEHVGDAPVFRTATGQPGVQIEVHSRFQHHPLAA